MKTPVGQIAVRTGPAGIEELRFGSGGIPATPLGRRVRRQLSDYFSGRRRTFTFPLLPEGTSFQKVVWKELLRIPFGKTRTYGEVARAIGRPRAVRAVGRACGANPIPILIPCHRVVSAGGGEGGYSSGLPKKRILLDLERAERRIRS